MAGLVEYASSDEEDEVQSAPVVEAPPLKTTEVHDASRTSQSEPEKLETSNNVEAPAQTDENAPLVGPARPLDDGQVGQSLPPMEEVFANDSASDQAPLSPYSRERAIIHDLTLPSVPNLDIPPSPPGSPTPLTNKKFEQFLELKKKGVHFNSKLESSAALRNPSLTDKLMGFVEIDEKGQYETTLPTDLWNPKGFPEWAFRDRLKKTREKVAKEKEADKASGNRSGIEFVPSTTTVGGGTSAAGGISQAERRKGGWK